MAWWGVAALRRFASMPVMGRRALATGVLGALLAVAAPGQAPRALSHRVWLLDGVPPAENLAVVRELGVDALVMPLGTVTLADRRSDLELVPGGVTTGLAGWRAVALVWVEGAGEAAGDAESFLAQAAPARRGLSGGGVGLVLAARRYWPGLPRFAMAVARAGRETVELALPATLLAERLPAQGWPGVVPVAVAFGNPEAVGWPFATIHDDLAALDAIAERSDAYGAAIVVRPLAEPDPGGGASLAALASARVATYRPGTRGDVFSLKRPAEWGTSTLPGGATVRVQVVQTSRFHRDLRLLLRPQRGALVGWDTVGLPRSSPSLGMSFEAFVDYFRGGAPEPRPLLQGSWSGASLELAVINDSPHASAVATTGNWVEVRFAGGQVADVEPGEFSGLEFGRVAGDAWTATVSGSANAVRLFLNYLGPEARLGGARIRFAVRPREFSARAGVRLGDGSSRTMDLRLP